MRLGVVFPQTEIGGDPAAICDYAQAAESLGYDHLLAYDHVVGANGPGATAKVEFRGGSSSEGRERESGRFAP